jgi:Protein of unknown function (DUF4242)
MAEFLVELYAAPSNGDAIAEQARAAAETASRSGALVRYLSSIFVPEDETCFLLYEANSLEDVRAAATCAGLVFERVTLAHARDAAKH